VVALEVTIEPGGELWGDVLAAAMQLQPGGKLHGCFTTLAEDDYRALSGGEVTPVEAMARSASPPDGAARAVRLVDGERVPDVRLEVIRLLQAEVVAAFSARAALEHSFETRLREEAGESMAEAARLADELRLAREAIRIAQGRSEEAAAVLQLREEQGNEQAKRLEALQSLLAERATLYQELKTTAEQAQLELERLRSANAELEQHVKTGAFRIEELGKRIEGLESALQASLQHSVEQEAALVRWQELAEITERRANELSEELQSALLRSKESHRVLEHLREQKERLRLLLEKAGQRIELVEAQWAEAERFRPLYETTNNQLAGLVVERDELAARLATVEAVQGESAVQIERLQGELNAARSAPGNLQEQLDAAKRQIVELESHLAEARVVANALDVVRRKIGSLEQNASDARRREREAADLALWYRTSLEATHAELAASREENEQKALAIVALQSELEERRGHIDKWRNNIGRLTELLYGAEHKARAAGAELTEVRQRLEREKEQLGSGLREAQLQLQAAEDEIDRYYIEITAQRNRYGEIQATLAEQLIEQQRMRAALAEQSEQLAQHRQVAADRIQTLESELSRSQQQLRDLTAWIERRKRREGAPEPAPAKLDSPKE
jgi:chromosome segregation ATPase